MSVEISPTQQKRVDKHERLLRYLGSDRPECHEWDPEKDELLDFKSMTDTEVTLYLASSD
jgi:hypothetical protein